MNIESGATPSDTALDQIAKQLQQVLGKSEEQQDGFPQIGRYQVTDVIGRGGQSFVYLARDVTLRRMVVLKFYKEAIDSDRNASVIREGQTLCELDVPGICKCLDVGVWNDHAYLVLEYVAGATLSGWIEEQTHTELETMELFTRVVDSLVDIHRHGLVHLDVKPSNIVVDRDNRARLIDFGIARRMGVPSPEPLSGTPNCMSPEQAKGQLDRIDIRSDIFGAGALLYHMLTGTPPYTGENRAEVLKKAQACDFQRPSQINASVSEAAESVCLKCMARNPDDRYQTSMELADAIRAWTLAADPPMTDRRNKVMRIAIPALLVLATLVVVWQWQPDNENRKAGREGQQTVSQRESAKPELSKVPFRTTKLLQEVLDGGTLNHPSRQEFQVNVSLKDRESEQILMSDFRQTRILELKLDQNVAIEIEPATDCYAAIISLECNKTSGELNQLKPVYPNEATSSALFLSAGKTHRYVIRATPVSSAMEYILVLASTEPWSPGELKNWFQSNSANETRVHDGQLWRGLEASGKLHDQVFELIIPYSVSE